ncbi:hypothetical protein [Hypericibacter sp.]|uniref:hypothetical protein n=1 Tax=Hypericibacter sp. TaxID=2705401 RepID=UPI003D6D3E10
MKLRSLLLAGGFALAPALACAADFDGSKPFLCSAVDVASCAPGDDCVRETAASVGAPQFFTVDVGKKVVTEAGSNAPHFSKIDRVAHQSGLLMLGGSEGPMTWVATINEANGKLSYAVLGERTAVVTFGACLAK